MVLATKQIHTPMHRIEDPEINPHSYSHLIFKKNVKKINVGEKTASSTNYAWETGYPHAD
jgi:hypothetical protein